MIVTCYFCNKSFPNSQMKRCARCRLVTYCSKECQAMSWKASHKFSCKPHPSLVSTTDPDKMITKEEKLKKFSPEWIELEVDRILSRWMQLWRFSFQLFGTLALDLANHPKDRVMTHCMYLVVEPRNFQDDPAKQYSIIEASIVHISYIKEQYPELEMHIDPKDFTRLRYAVRLQNVRGEPRRVRLLQWNDRSLDKWRTMDKKASAAMIGKDGESWSQSLMWAVESQSPSMVEKSFRGRTGF